MAEKAKTDNLRIYNAAREVPAEAIKEIKGGRLAGFSDINPMWRIKRMTEIYGPCGLGWYYEVTEKDFREAGGETAVFVTINLYVKDAGEWSRPIQGTGGSKFVTIEKSGPYVSDEAVKMALTDALSVAMKSLGIAADIYFAKDRTKYTDPVSAPAPAPKTAPKAARPAKDAAAIPPYDLNRAIKDIEGCKDIKTFTQAVNAAKKDLSPEDWDKLKPIGARKQKELLNANGNGNGADNVKAE